MKKKIIALFLVVALALSMTVLMGGCTNGDNGETNGDGGLTKVTVAEFRTLGWASSYVAQELGYYEDEGIEVEFAYFKDGPLAFQAMQAGSADFVLMSQELPLRAFTDGQESVFVAAVQSTRQYMIVARDEYTDVSQLAGTTMFAGSPGSTPYTFVTAVLEDYGVDPSTIEFANTDYSSAMTSLANGNIDASYLSIDFWPDFERINTGNVLFSTADPETHREFFGSDTSEGEIIACTKAFRDEHPETVQKYINAVVRAMKWMKEHTGQEIAELITSYFTSMTVDELAERIDLLMPAYSPDGYISEDGYNALSNFCYEHGIIEQEIPYDTAVDMSFVNNANGYGAEGPTGETTGTEQPAA